MKKSFIARAVPLLVAAILGALASQIIAPTMQLHATIPFPQADPVADAAKDDAAFAQEKAFAQQLFKYQCTHLVVANTQKTVGQLQKELENCVLGGMSVKTSFAINGATVIVMSK